MSQISVGSLFAEKAKSKSQLSLEHVEPKLAQESARLRNGSKSIESLKKSNSKKSLKS